MNCTIIPPYLEQLANDDDPLPLASNDSSPITPNDPSLSPMYRWDIKVMVIGFYELIDYD
jgi:hypothetical protein